MRAAVCGGLGESLEIREVPVPRPGPRQVLVRIHAAGVCHTDLSLIDGAWEMKRPSFPFIPGHEGCGQVAAFGSGVTRLKEGDRVGIFWLNSACGECEYCTTSREPYCKKQVGTGYDACGTFAEYCLVSEDYAVPLPAGPCEQYAPVMCAGVTGYKGVKELGVEPGQWIVILGVGGTGHLAIQYAKAMGLKVAAIDIDDEKVMLAEELGVDLAFNAGRRSPVNKINALCGGVHGALVAADSPQAYEQAIRMLRRGGTCVVIGISKEAMSISPFELVIKGLTVRGSLIGSRRDLWEAMELVSAGSVMPRIETRPLEEVNAALDSLRGRRVRGRAVLQIG
jgi:propanol-preferring alcohol dehydrogenase